MANGLNSTLEQLYGSCALNPRKINTVMTWKTIFSTKLLSQKVSLQIFYGLGGPEPGGQVGLPLPHLPEGVHCGALLVVPQPGVVGGEGARGTPTPSLCGPYNVSLGHTPLAPLYN